jgi:hypothetical protein
LLFAVAEVRRTDSLAALPKQLVAFLQAVEAVALALLHMDWQAAHHMDSQEVHYCHRPYFLADSALEAEDDSSFFTRFADNFFFFFHMNFFFDR